METKLLKRIMGIVRGSVDPSPPPIAPSPENLAAPVNRPLPNPSPRVTAVPGNFYSFEFFIELKSGDVVHVGYPKICVRDQTTGAVRWGSKIEWAWPDPAKRRVAWVDHEDRGLQSRTLAMPEDALGAEGMIGDTHFRFEKILDLGKNQIVYALYCAEKKIRLAYGFDRHVFEPTYVYPSQAAVRTNAARPPRDGANNP